MKKRLLASLLSLSMAATLLPPAAFAAAGETDVSTREELAAALADPSVSVINVTAGIAMGSDYWTPPVIERDLTINGNGNVISGMKVNTGVLKPSGSGVAGDGGSCDYYAGFIGSNKGELTINDLDFSGAFVDMDPLSVNEKSTGSSILAVVCANNSGTLVYNDVDVAASEVRGYTKAGLLHGFSQGKSASFTANRCSIVNSTVVVEADGSDPEASLNGMIVGYDGNNAAKTNGIKLENNKVVIDESVQWAAGIDYDETTGLYTSGDWGVFCETYAHGSYDTDAVVFTAEADGYLYETLADAVAATESGVITMKASEKLSDMVTIPENANITLDLAGKAITVPKAVNGRSLYAITNNGTFTLMDSVGGGKISSRGTQNFGTMTVNSGTIESIDSNGGGASVWNEGGTLTVNGGSLNTTGERSGSNAATAINNLGGVVTIEKDANFDCTYHAVMNNKSTDGATGGKTTINGGTFKVSGEDYAYAITNYENCELIINDADVKANGGAIGANTGKLVVNGGSFSAGKFYALWITNDGVHTDVEVNGGTFYGKSHGLYASVDDGNQDVGDVRIRINDGNFSGGTAAALGEKFSNNEWSLSISGGLFSSDPSEYLASGKTVLKGDYTVDGISYGYKVGDPVIADAEVAVTEGETKADAPSSDKVNVPEDSPITPDSLKENAEGVTSDGLTAEASSQVETLLKDQTAEKAEDALIQAGVKVDESATITIVAEPYLDIAVDSYSETGQDTSVVKELALDITAKYSVKVTTADNPADMDDSNTATISTGNTLNVDSPITISVPLPEGFVDSTDDVVYVQHKGYEYKATVTGDAASGFTAEFVNPHGFSLFTLSTVSAAEASIGSTSYTSVQDALRAVKDGETLTVLKPNLSAEVNGNKTFKLAGEKITLTPAAGYKMTIKNNTVTVWEEANIPSVPGTVSPSKSGWVQSGSDWYYYKSGVKATGWIIDNGVRYYLHEDGKMATGWLKLDGHWYYFYKWGGMAENGWVLDNNVWYYLNADGKMATGWLLYRGSWYYLYRWGGMAQTGWVLDNNVWYYLKDDGKMATGWLYDKGSWYYLRDWGGMIASKALVIDGVTYHFAESGEMK